MEDLRFATSLHIMIYLADSARQGDDLVTSTFMASGMNANPALIRKLLAPLVEAGLVETVQGKNGGARIARPAKLITLKEIYLASVDKELAFSRGNVNANCPIGASMKKVFGDLAEGMERARLTYLETTTLQQFLRKF
jgi:Rrf2 family transcriptional regulator, repressor of oqxAB